MKLTLLVNGKEKVYSVQFVSGLVFRKAIQIEKKLQEDGFNLDLLDELVDFIVWVFNGQFTSEEFYGGIRNTDLFETIIDLVKRCINGEDIKEKH